MTASPFRVLLLALLLVFGGAPTAIAQDLPQIATRLDETSVSGISSGAYMAGQFQLAHSRIVIGAALIAGGPFGCAESTFADQMPGPGMMFLNASKAVNACMLDSLKSWGIPDPRHLAERARKLAAAGRIDPIVGVLADRIYLFAGLEDRTVMPAIVASAETFYRALGVPGSAIRHVVNIPAGHGFVTEAQGLACGQTGQPFVVACGYDQARELLTHIYGPL